MASSTTGSVEVLVAMIVSWPTTRVDLGEQRLLHGQVLDDGLDHEVAVGQVGRGRPWP